MKTFNKIRDWADARGIYEKGNVKTQYIKLQEEAGELAKAILNNDKPEIIDGIGDIVVVLTNLAHLSNTDNRKGIMINGTFVKTNNLSEAEITLLMDDSE